MNKFISGVIIISALVWAQTAGIILPKLAGNTDTRLCCSRPVKPAEVKPEKIESEVKAEQRLSQGWAFLILDSKDPQSMKEIFNSLEKNGINTNGLRWPPHCATIKATKDDEAKILSVEGIRAIYYGQIDLDDVPYKDEFTTGAVEYWNKFISGEFDENIQVPGLEPPKNDMLIPPQNYRYESDYMVGSVATCIFFPESHGVGNENWTPTLRNNVINEVQAGLQRWVNWASAERPPVNLSFSVYYYDYTQTPTDCEPITLNSYHDEYRWIHDCMDGIGVPYFASYFARVSWFNNWLRDTFNTDWAHSIFVANSFVDTDGCFADGWFAYAYLGGPFQQMTYDNNGYGISGMDWVCAHETGHNFYAYDEYAASGCNCTQSQNGYQNQNCANGCASNVTCLMRNAYETPVCYYTKGHVGWDPEVYTLSDDVTQSLGYPYPRARKYQYNQGSNYWAVTGVRPNSGSDWNIRLYSDNGFGTELASSTYSGTTVDFVVADYNHSPTGLDAVHVSRYSGASGATVEWDNAAEYFSYPNSYSASWPGGDVVEMIDYYIDAPYNLTFTLDITSGTADLGFGIFNSSGSSYYAGRSGMLAWADANGSGGDETFNINLTASDWYGIIVWANNTATANYTISAGSVGIAENNNKELLDKEYALNAWPNPCKGSLKIDYRLSPNCKTGIIKVFDISGKLRKNYQVSAEPDLVQSVIWDCKDNNGTSVPEGVYFITLETGDSKEISKIVLLK